MGELRDYITEENIAEKRAEIDNNVGNFKNADWDKWVELCDIDEITIKGGDGQDMKV